jgi:cell division protein FtsQ
MTAARVRRGATTRHRSGAKVAVPKKIVKRLPVDQARANRLAGIAFGLFLAIIAAVTIVALGLPQKLWTATGEALGRAGFTVKRVDVVGIHHMNSAPVYQIALGQRSMAMPLVDVSAIRSQLLQYGWIKDARVSRRFPDTLVIDVVERKPAALWQDNGQLALIDSGGTVIDHVPVDKMPDLPLLIGPGANQREGELNALMNAAPSLKPQLVSATWVGGRRWDLNFQTGETVALPEGDDTARDALAKFAELDKSAGLLGRGLVRFDLRIPGKMIGRFSHAIAPITPAPPAAATTAPAAPPAAAAVPSAPTTVQD